MTEVAMNVEPINAAGVKVLKLELRDTPVKRGFRTSLVQKTVMFVHIDKETPLENFIARMNQRAGAPARLTPRDIRKHILPEVLKQLKEKFPKEGITENTKLHFSRKAGCSMCPCSPGFFIEGSWNKTVYVTVGAPDDRKES